MAVLWPLPRGRATSFLRITRCFGLTAQLHYDILRAQSERNPTLKPIPSYSSIRRYFQSQGWRKRRRLTTRDTAGARRAEARLMSCEVRSYEAVPAEGRRAQALSTLPVEPAWKLSGRAPESRWLVTGLWSCEAVGIVGGEPKCCKSFLAPYLAVAVASGAPALRRFPVAAPGRVLLYAAGVTTQMDNLLLYQWLSKAPLRSRTKVLFSGFKPLNGLAWIRRQTLPGEVSAATILSGAMPVQHPRSGSRKACPLPQPGAGPTGQSTPCRAYTSVSGATWAAHAQPTARKKTLCNHCIAPDNRIAYKKVS